MYGQMTASSWITTSAARGIYSRALTKRLWKPGASTYNGNLRGRWVLTAGLGMGGAQPYYNLAGACSLNIECQQSRIDFRLRTGYVDEQASLIWMTPDPHCPLYRKGEAVSIALHGNAAEILPELVKTRRAPGHGDRPDQRNDPSAVYLPLGMSWEDYRARAQSPPGGDDPRSESLNGRTR